MRYAVIMAGGSGTRLWPLSRKSRPKQLLRILGNKSQLELAVERVRGFLEPENIYIITNAHYAQAVRDESPELPAANIIGEPEGRDTANAIGLAAAILAKKDPQAVMGVFTADHVIEPVDVFARTVERAYELAQNRPESLITFGLKPTWAHTGLGYIHASQPISSAQDDYQAFKVQSFKEKPSSELAREYCNSGEYYWNSGMFVWQARTILDQLQKFLPKSYAKLQQIAQSWDTPAGPEIFRRTFLELEKISIDYAVMEKASDVLVVVLPCSWVDIGSWSTLEDVLEADEQGNVATVSSAEIIDSKNNVIVSEDAHLFGLIGVKDLVVVHSPKATLVCHKSQTQRVKELVARLQEKGRLGI